MNKRLQRWRSSRAGVQSSNVSRPPSCESSTSRVSESRSAHVESESSEPVTTDKKSLNTTESWFMEFGNFAAARQFEVLEDKFEGLFADESLVGKINGATVLLGELSELNQRYSGKPWTLVFICKAYHVRVECELGPYLAEPEQLAIDELLRLHDFIRAYDKAFSNNLCESVKEELPPNTFPCYEEKLRQTYADTLESSTRTWVSNIAANILNDGARASYSDLGNAVGTNAPVDLLRIVCETLAESSTGGNPKIEEVATSCCVMALGHYLDLIKAKLRRTDDTVLLCALANDCSTIVDYVDSNLIDESEHLGFEDVSTKYTNGAVQIIESVAGKVVLDLKPWLSLRYKKIRLQEDVQPTVSNICGLIKSSLADLKGLLQPVLFQKLRRLLLRQVMIEYFAGLLQLCGRKPLAKLSKIPKLTTEEVGQIVADKETLIQAFTECSRSSPSQRPTLGQDVFVDLVRILTQPSQQIEPILRDLCQAYEQEALAMLLAAQRCVALRADVSEDDFERVSELVSTYEARTLDSPPSSLSVWSNLLPETVEHSFIRVGAMASGEIASRFLASLSALRQSIQTENVVTQNLGVNMEGASPIEDSSADLETEERAVEKFIETEESLVVSTLKIGQLKSLCKAASIQTEHCLTREDLVVALKAKIVHVDPNTLIKAVLVKVSMNTGILTSVKVKIIEYAVRLAANDGLKVLEAKGLHALGTLYLSIPEKLQAAPAVLHMAADMFFAVNEIAEYESSLIDAAKAYQCMGEDEKALSLLTTAKTHSETNSMIKRVASVTSLNTAC